MKFLVYTPFRCGSSFITFLLKKNTNYPIYFGHERLWYKYIRIKKDIKNKTNGK
jgi:hypothetical protein